MNGLDWLFSALNMINLSSTNTGEERVEKIKKEKNKKGEEKKEKKETKDKNKKNKEKKKDELGSAFMADDMLKLKEKTERHKEQTKKVLFVCVAIDLIIAAILALPPAVTSTPQSASVPTDIINQQIARLWNVYYDTLDCSVSIILRLLCLYVMTQLALIWGHPHTYDSAYNQSLNRTYTIQEIILNLVMRGWKWITNKALRRDEQQILKRRSPTDHKLTVNVEEILSKYNNQDPQDIAEFWQGTLWLLLFTSMTCFQAWIGFKITIFSDDSTSMIALFAMIVMLCHLEIYACRLYIEDSTESDNKYFNPRIHTHALYLRTLRATCDLCWEKISKKGYRCSKCDFDVCKKCWKSGNQARAVAENQLRSDSGVSASQDTEVGVMEYLTRLFEFYLPHRWWLLFGMLCMSLNTYLELAMPSKKGKLLDLVLEMRWDAFVSSIEKFVLFTVVSEALASIHKMIMNQSKEQVYCKIQQMLYHRIMAQDTVFFDGSSVGSLSERLEWGLRDMLAPFQTIVGSFIHDVAGFVGGLYICWSLSWRLTLLALSTLGPLSYLTMLFSRFHYGNIRVVEKLNHDLFQICREGFENIRTVRSYGKEPRLVEEFCQLRNEVHWKQMSMEYMNALNNTLNSWFSLFSTVVLTFAGGLLMFQGAQKKFPSFTSEPLITSGQMFLTSTISAGAMVSFQALWKKTQNHFDNLRTMFPSVDRARFMARQILRTLDSISSIELLDHKAGKQLAGIDGDIKYENVRFTYQLEPNKEVLKGINITFEKGKRTALVGRSGSGKTTVLSLLMRFYDPTMGRITINGVDMREYNVYSVRKRMAMVAQDTELFTNTIEHNVAYSVDEYTEEDLFRACTLAQAHQFIQSFDDKYKSRVGKKGTRLSGGQKQRLSIARVLMRKPEVMILDEATSSLDGESEALVQAALEQAIADQQCTVIIVAHRLSTVASADKIIVIDDGRIVEQGTHNELVAEKGLYAKMVERQINLQSKARHNTGQEKNDPDKPVVPPDTIDQLLDDINQ